MGKILATMDMWSDLNLAPFMAVMAHWIQDIWEETVSTKRLILKLRLDWFPMCSGSPWWQTHGCSFSIYHIEITGRVCYIQILVAQFKSWNWSYIVRSAGLHLIKLQTTTHLWLTFNVTVQLGGSWDPWTQTQGGSRGWRCISSLPK